MPLPVIREAVTRVCATTIRSSTSSPSVDCSWPPPIPSARWPATSQATMLWRVLLFTAPDLLKPGLSIKLPTTSPRPSSVCRRARRANKRSGHWAAHTRWVERSTTSDIQTAVSMSLTIETTSSMWVQRRTLPVPSFLVVSSITTGYCTLTGEASA
ncbi:hypothetical protein CF68_29985 [Cupriavidus sp. SK-4]|nr:hypothetical protein CF68_29985 [Cupriavidus sp. SK-4]